MMRSRRGLLIAGSAVILAWVLFRGVPTALDNWRKLRWQVEDRARLLAEYRRTIRGESVLSDSAEAIKQNMLALTPTLLTGTTAAQAGDAMVRLLEVISDRSNTRLTGTQPVADSAAAGPLLRVSTRAAIEGDISGLVLLLRGLGEDDVVLDTDDLSIMAVETTTDPNSAEVLRAEVTVRGWYLATGVSER